MSAKGVGENSILPQFSGVESSPPKAALDEIIDSLTRIKQQHPGFGADKKLADACLQGMLAGLDRQSAFLDEEEFKELQVGTPPLGGLGIELGIDADFPKIISPIEGGPADRGGLKTGDIIAKIESSSTKGLLLRDVVKRLRGPVGSTITLTIEREGAAQPLEFVLTREVIRIESVKWRSVAPGYAYIRISQFQQRTPVRLANAIESAYRENQGDLKGLILDLRNNSGGLLPASVGVAAAFLPERWLVVNTDGRTQDSKMQLTANRENYLRDRNAEDYIKKLPPQVKTVPMVILVNRRTASASEIVAAALQDHKRAKILGARTFGEGSIQTIFPLGKNAALRLTTARFFRPSGEPIAAIGITPDVLLEEGTGLSPALGSGEDSQLMQALRTLGADPTLGQR